MAQIGSFALLLALALSVYSFAVGFAALFFQGDSNWERLGETARRAGVVVFGAVVLAAIALVVAAVRDVRDGEQLGRRLLLLPEHVELGGRGVVELAAPRALRLGALRRVLIPMSRPGLVATVIFTFIHAWNEFVFALVFISSPNLKSLPGGPVPGHGAR